MMGLPAGVRVWLAAGFTDLRKGFDGLSALVQTVIGENPYSGQVFVFRGRRGDRIKILWDSQDGLCLFQKRLRGGGIYLAACRERHGILKCGATVDVARGDRLAQTQAHRTRPARPGSHPAEPLGVEGTLDRGPSF